MRTADHASAGAGPMTHDSSPGPLDPSADEIVRTRLVDALAGRWARAVTLIEAPAGYGKSVALAQAVRQNRADPVGIDVVVECRSFHSHSRALVSAIAKSLRTRVDVVGESAEAHADALLAAASDCSPTPVCILLDDLHHLRADESAMLVVHHLLRELPSTVHLVLAARALPRLPLARFRAGRTVHTLTADDLLFTAEEVAELAKRNRIGVETLHATQGWPALTQLAIHAGTTGTVDYLLDEIVSRLNEESAEALAWAVLGRGLPATWLTDASGHAIEAVVEEVPLLSLSASGTVVAHDLWASSAELIVDAAKRVRIASRLAARYVELARFDEAIAIATEHHAWASAKDALVGLTMGGDSFPNAERYRSLYSRFPNSERGEPELVLLDAVIGRITNEPDASRKADAALAELQHRGVPRHVAAAAFEVGYSAWLRGDIGRVLEMYGLARELVADGNVEIAPFAQLVEAISADLQGDVGTSVQLLESIDLSLLPGPLVVYVLRELMSKLQLLGEPYRALPYGDRLRTYSVDPRAEFSVALAHWLAEDPEVALGRWDELRHRSVGHNLTDFLTWTYSAHIDASLGLAAPLQSVPEYLIGRSRERTFLALGRAAMLVGAGNEGAAAEEIETLVDEVEVDDTLMLGELKRQPVIPFVLSARVQAALRNADLGPSHAARVALAECVLAVRAGDLDSVAQHLRSVSADQLLTALPLRWAGEVVVALAGVDEDAAVRIVEQLSARTNGRLFDVLRPLGARSSESERAVGVLLARAGDQHGAAARLLVCGEMTIVRGGGGATTVARPRVRQLLGLLVLRRELPIDAVLAELWPEMAPAQARTNLAASLRLLRDQLDRDVDGGPVGVAESLIVRDDRVIRLRRPRSLSCDLWDIERELDVSDRHRSVGDHERALRAQEAALAHWAEAMLIDVADLGDSAAALDVVAINRRLIRASCDVAEWHLARNAHEAASRHAERALREDPYEERAHAVAIEAAVRSTSTDGVSLATQRCREALAELGVVPSRTLAIALRRAGAVVGISTSAV